MKVGDKVVRTSYKCYGRLKHGDTGVVTYADGSMLGVDWGNNRHQVYYHGGEVALKIALYKRQVLNSPEGL